MYYIPNDDNNILSDSMIHYIVHTHILVSFYCNQRAQFLVVDTEKICY